MTVAPANASVLVMDPQLGILIPTDLSTTADSFLLDIMMTAGATGPSALHIPTTLRIGDNMIGFRSLGHD